MVQHWNVIATFACSLHHNCSKLHPTIKSVAAVLLLSREMSKCEEPAYCILCCSPLISSDTAAAFSRRISYDICLCASPLGQRSCKESRRLCAGAFSRRTVGEMSYWYCLTCYGFALCVIYWHLHLDWIITLCGMSICDYLQTVLSNLGDLGKITLSTSGPPEPDHSLLKNLGFWEVTTAQYASSKSFNNTI